MHSDTHTVAFLITCPFSYPFSILLLDLLWTKIIVLTGLWHTFNGGGRTYCLQRTQINKNSCNFRGWHTPLLQETGI